MPSTDEMIDLLREVSTEDNVEITTAIVEIIRSRESWNLTQVEVIRRYLERVMNTVGIERDPDWYKNFYVEAMLVFHDMGGFNDE